MKRMNHIRLWNLQFWWISVVTQLFSPMFGRTLAKVIRHDPKPAPGVEVFTHDNRVVLRNGIVNITLSAPGGLITKISYNGIDNILKTQNEKDNRGYWDIVWNKMDANIIRDRLEGTSYKIVVQEENQIEISFTRSWNISMNGKLVPLNVDKRFVMLQGSPGFYSYTVLERLQGWPNFNMEEARIVFKLQEKMFRYMAISKERQRVMPMPVDRLTGRVLDYPEAVHLTKPTNPQFKGEVDDKYFYSCDNKDNRVHGWVSKDPPVGFWMITASDEFRTGGPLKQDLTVHVGPTVLNMFTSNHYSGDDLTLKFGDGEPWKKVLGPVFVYLNSNRLAKGEPAILWQDAQQKMLDEVSKWPYTFPSSKDYIQPKERGKVRGQLLVYDRFINKKPKPGSSAFVGLALPGDAGSWQRENKGYQFWTKTDSMGNFVIKGVIPCTYALYAWVPFTIGDYKYDSNVTVHSGSDINLGNLLYNPPRNGPTLWEIGVADRTAAEFFIPSPIPSFKVHTYKSDEEIRETKFREYGLWRRYTDLFPLNDLVYEVGVSNYTRDWFFAHVPRDVGNYTYKATTWSIVFHLESLSRDENYTLQLALASANEAELQVRINNGCAEDPHFTTGEIGEDNAIARHGIHGLYWLFSVDVPGKLLVQGKNIIFLTQSRDTGPFKEIMYDYIRLETPDRM